MSARNWDRITRRCVSGFSFTLALSVLLVVPAALGQLPQPNTPVPVPRAQTWPSYVIPGGPQASTLYADGSQVTVQTQEVWKLICGSDPAGVTSADLRQWATEHHRIMAQGNSVPVSGQERSGGITINYNADASVPAAALSAFAMAQTYIESLFSNPITVTVNVTFQNLGGGGVIGATSSMFVPNVPYATSRAGLVNGMDADDVIQSWLPTTTYVPVRFDWRFPTVTNQPSVTWTVAGYNATVGSVGGVAANMSFNTQFAPNFAYDPTNGVPGNQLSFVDVVVHETGHALGFISGADNFGGINFTSLDLFRFQRSANNPTTYAEFQSTPRLVSYLYTNTGDDVNANLVVAQYRLEDGFTWQASHWKQQPPYIGIMEPALSNGETHYPNFYSAADIAMIDAIGYNYPACPTPLIMNGVSDQTTCLGQSATFTVTANNALSYQWRRGPANLADGGNISGATTSALTINPVGLADAGAGYNVVVTNACGNTDSNMATLHLTTGPSISNQPVTHAGAMGYPTSFSVTAAGTGTLSYQWRKGGVNLTDGGHISGVTSATLTLNPVAKADAGGYDVMVTDTCGTVTSSAVTLWLAGDLNCDGLVDFSDINPFVLLLSCRSCYTAQYPNCPYQTGDCNNDGQISFADINPFVAVLSAP